MPIRQSQCAFSVLFLIVFASGILASPQKDDSGKLERTTHLQVSLDIAQAP
jgi:hypothetical protein